MCTDSSASEPATAPQPGIRQCAILVGGMPSDLAAAEAAGIRGQLFPGGDLLDTVKPLLST